MALRHLFATPVYEASLSTDRNFENFRAELETACRMLAAEDAAGRAWCKAHGYGVLVARRYIALGRDHPSRIEFRSSKRHPARVIVPVKTDRFAELLFVLSLTQAGRLRPPRGGKLKPIIGVGRTVGVNGRASVR